MEQAVAAALKAGQEIMKIYESEDFDVETKEDDSPLTRADRAAHGIIVKKLEEGEDSLPILSEEGSSISYEERKEWGEFWLVDPLDGTKEFLKKNGEFTVNIARIRDGKPVFGVVYAPALEDLYVAVEGKGAFKLTSVLRPEWEKKATVLPALPAAGDTARIVASRSHMSEDTKEFIGDLEMTYDSVETVSAGSSLKFCLVAEGVADYYPRYAPTMEWDTAAGQAIVELAGGSVGVANSIHSLTYNKEDLHNPWFLATRG
ncbi:3'(2'),5'-bisphosphate nucleotidase [Salimicrobium jeotgali]|uniref:3'(2'),5'-bisphosphate nucleotidase CysQ n=1 Tax=Salimicrobium jeotgali TaxID=1230341 RepID=K2FJP3_9BACI|nr:3'(2'),5'-bisphosphate nucleotidase CysQ [Salimicrobium jeotgali]AKG03794.1 3'(2'),5'-bisphosphate nucleotidase [Salimicrobium jeotgali]EKE31281.1 3'(2'),5'-bisphosphate nucleotidase [Salimicrobium jeotgali]MBM7697093.1 3'(2'), 5'-bisphosphate nucleotidase [Salimicrobium jeotgali]